MNKKLTKKENKKLKNSQKSENDDEDNNEKTKKDNEKDEIEFVKTDKNDAIDEDEDYGHLEDEKEEAFVNPLRKIKEKTKKLEKVNDKNKDKNKGNNEANDQEMILSSDTEEDDLPSKNKTGNNDDLFEDNSEENENELGYDTDEKAEIRAIAKKMLRKKDRLNIFAKSYNRYYFDDQANAPKWFVEDENMHNTPIKPVTKQEILEEKEYLKEVNSRLPKKVLQAKNRKKRKIALRMEKVKKMAQNISNQEEINEKSKINQIEKLYKKKGAKTV